MAFPESMSVNQAFSKQSSHFDEDDQNNLVLQWMRSQVRKHTSQYLRPGNKILELNAGTGLDAVYFVQHGYKVVATDLSTGMIEELKKKVTHYNLQDKLTVKQLSYTDLQPLYDQQFDHIFSNFGGLNCVQDLRRVTGHFKHLLKPGGYATLVIMQPVCPWEIIMALKGKFKYAFRRLNNKHTVAHLEGFYFDTWYFSPKQVLSCFDQNFKKISLKGLATFTPPPEHQHFPRKFPKLFRLCNNLDEKLCKYFPFNLWGDHFILTVQFNPGK